MKKILEHIKRYRGMIFTIIVLTVLQVGSTLLTPTILASLVSNGILKQDQATIIQQGGLMLLTTTLDLVLSVTVVRFVGKFSAGLARVYDSACLTKFSDFQHKTSKNLVRLLISIVQLEIYKACLKRLVFQ